MIYFDRQSLNYSIIRSQTKVHQLYQLDQLMHEESGTLQSLQRDKEDLERALGGLRKRIQDGNGPPQIIEAARKQQHTLERELSRVHQMLADNSKVVKVPSRRRFLLFLFLCVLVQQRIINKIFFIIIVFICLNNSINNCGSELGYLGLIFTLL